MSNGNLVLEYFFGSFPNNASRSSDSSVELVQSKLCHTLKYCVDHPLT